MKLVENKKLFGKINLMDIIISVVILVVAVIAYNVIFKNDTSAGIGAKYYTTTCTMRFEGMPVNASEYLKVGADVYDNETNTYIGKLVDVTSGDYLTLRANKENDTYVESKVPNKENVYVTMEVSVSDQGADLVTANNYYIKVGKAISIRSSNFAGGGYITTIDREAK